MKCPVCEIDGIETTLHNGACWKHGKEGLMSYVIPESRGVKEERAKNLGEAVRALHRAGWHDMAKHISEIAQDDGQVKDYLGSTLKQSDEPDDSTLLIDLREGIAQLEKDWRHIAIVQGQYAVDGVATREKEQVEVQADTFSACANQLRDILRRSQQEETAEPVSRVDGVPSVGQGDLPRENRNKVD